MYIKQYGTLFPVLSPELEFENASLLRTSVAKQLSNLIRCWGHKFELCDDHPSAEELHPLKFSYDTLGEETLLRLDEISPPLRSALPRNNSSQLSNSNISTGDVPQNVSQERDLYKILEDNKDKDQVLGKFWGEVNKIPEWVDWDQIARGQDVFYRYGGAALTGLAYHSLLGGMGAGRVVETLARTGGFSTKVARRRLYETTQHILQCTKSIDSMKPGGEGFSSSIRVRLLHAAVRNRILKLQKHRPEYYRTEAWGIPINDLDSIGTITIFSSSLIWISLPRQGIFLRHQETTDFLALWRYVAHVMGCPTEFFRTPAKAKAIMESLLMYEIEPSEMSKVLANNIIRSLQDQPPTYMSADMLVASARWLNGEELADRLDLPPASWYHWSLMAGQCVFFMVICYTYRYVDYLDRRKINALRKIFYAVIVESKSGLAGTETTFDLKYIPEYNTVTELGTPSGKRTTSRVEKRNLQTFLIAAGVLGAVGWYLSICMFRVLKLLVQCYFH